MEHHYKKQTMQIGTLPPPSLTLNELFLPDVGKFPIISILRQASEVCVFWDAVRKMHQGTKALQETNVTLRAINIAQDCTLLVGLYNHDAT